MWHMTHSYAWHYTCTWLCVCICVHVCVCMYVSYINQTIYNTPYNTPGKALSAVPFARLERVCVRVCVSACVCKRVQSLSVVKCEKTSMLVGGDWSVHSWVRAWEFVHVGEVWLLLWLRGGGVGCERTHVYECACISALMCFDVCVDT